MGFIFDYILFNICFLESYERLIFISILAHYSTNKDKNFEQHYIGMNLWKLYFDDKCYGRGSRIKMHIVSQKNFQLNLCLNYTISLRDIRTMKQNTRR